MFLEQVNEDTTGRLSGISGTVLFRFCKSAKVWAGFLIFLDNVLIFGGLMCNT